MEEQLQKIITSRIKFSIGSVIFILFLIGYGMYKYSMQETFSNLPFIMFILVTGLILAILLYYLNKLNSPIVKPWYRKLNKWVYLYGGIVFLVWTVIDFINKLIKFNLFNMGPPSLESPTAANELIDLSIDAAVGVATYKNIRAAKQVELIFKTRELQASMLQANPAQPPATSV